MAKESLTVTDNRTGKSYEIPIQNGAIRLIGKMPIPSQPRPALRL